MVQPSYDVRVAPAAPMPGHTVPELVSRLLDDARSVVSTEVELQKARLGERASAYKSAVVFFAAAGVLALAALIALLVGLILTLATLIGPGLATLAVVVAVLAAAGALGLVGRSRLAPPDLDKAHHDNARGKPA